jgi:hypothetical protein
MKAKSCHEEKTICRDERSEDNEGENVNAQGVDEAESEPGSEQKKNQQTDAQKNKSR